MEIGDNTTTITITTTDTTATKNNIIQIILIFC